MRFSAETRLCAKLRAAGEVLGGFMVLKDLGLGFGLGFAGLRV